MSAAAVQQQQQHTLYACTRPLLTLSTAFLNGKSWHPMNFANQKALWLAEQQAAARAAAEAKARVEAEESAEFLRCASCRVCLARALCVDTWCLAATAPLFQARSRKDSESRRR